MTTTNSNNEGDDPLFAIKDPSGNINHCHLGCHSDEVIAGFIEEEMVLGLCGLSEPGLPRNWEHYEAVGYSIAKVNIIEI